MGSAFSKTNHGREDVGPEHQTDRNALVGPERKCGGGEFGMLLQILSLMTPFIIPDRLTYWTSYHWMVRSQLQLRSSQEVAASSAIDELIKTRRDAHQKKAREEIESKLKSIEDKANKISLHDPLHPSRPYGLAEDMEGLRRHVWDLIFAHVNDLERIENLREVCAMFRDLLERKYVASFLPDVISECLKIRTIPWNAGSRTEISDWVKVMSSLRSLSIATEESVDYYFDRGMLAKTFWFHFQYPYYRTDHFKIPTLMFGALDSEQVWLEETLKTSKNCFPRALVFAEYLPDGAPVDLEELRNVFENCLEKIGWRIKSFCYAGYSDTPLTTYNNLRRWVRHLPNLEELIMAFVGQRGGISFGNIETFPTCPKLKRYAEGAQFGFGFPYINKIIEANPTIEEILLGEAPTSHLEVENIKRILDTLPLKKFYCSGMPCTPFLEHRFKWSLELKHMVLWDSEYMNSFLDIPSDELFEFISRFENLEVLTVSSIRVRHTGGYLRLPKLREFLWKVDPKFTSFEFLKHVASLKYLELDVTSCPPDLQSEDKLMQLLGKYHIPSLFPSLRIVYVVRDWNMWFKKIWVR